MLRKERKVGSQNAQLKPKKAEKKCETKNKGSKQKTVTNMVDISPTI